MSGFTGLPDAFAVSDAQHRSSSIISGFFTPYEARAGGSRQPSRTSIAECRFANKDLIAVLDKHWQRLDRARIVVALLLLLAYLAGLAVVLIAADPRPPLLPRILAAALSAFLCLFTLVLVKFLPKPRRKRAMQLISAALLPAATLAAFSLAQPLDVTGFWVVIFPSHILTQFLALSSLALPFRAVRCPQGRSQDLVSGGAPISGGGRPPIFRLRPQITRVPPYVLLATPGFRGGRPPWLG